MASSLTTSLITPLPSKTTSSEIIDLPPLGLWQHSTVPSVLAFDHELDKDRLIEAIKLLSSIWPTIAGRFERRACRLADGSDGHSYFIRLTSSAIPFSTQDFTGAPFPTNDVIQATVEPFAPDIGSKRGAFSRGPSDDSDAHLFAVRLTTVTNGTSRTSLLGVNTSHTITDGATLNKLLHHLSHCYVHLAVPSEADWPVFNPKIYFEKSDVPFPPDEQMCATWAVEWVTGPKIPPDIVFKVNEDDGMKVVKLFVSRTEIHGIRRDMQTTEVRLSEQDVLSAWWFSVLRRVDVPVRYVSHVFNARLVLPASDACIDESLSRIGVSFSNFCQFPLPLPTTTTTTTTASQLTSDAVAIRNTITALRTDPHTVLEWLSYTTWQMQLFADAGLRSSLEPALDSEVVCVNSNSRYDWTPTFGGESARYHTFWAGRRFLRVFQRNPEVGEKSTVFGERDLELVFKVEGGRYERVMEVVEGDRRRWRERVEGMGK